MMESLNSVTAPEGTGLGKALTRITSSDQKKRYVVAAFLLSTFGFFVASIPLGTATLVIGRVLLRNRIKTWGYFFCFVGTLWALGLPLLSFMALIKTESITIIPPVTQAYEYFKVLLLK